jgi:phosphoribosylformylglycinamidine cyclo-ligase
MGSDGAKGAHLVREGDCAIGISSTGFHSNGYSLVRKLFQSDLHEFGERLLQPTALYTDLVRNVTRKTEVHAMAHITGSGFLNLPRVLPSGYGVRLKRWEWPPLFKEAQRRAQISEIEMLHTFNCGIGWIFVAPQTSANEIHRLSQSMGYKTYDLGSVAKGIDGISEQEFQP